MDNENPKFVNTEEIRRQSKSELLEILDSIRGRKCLVLDGPISALLDHIFLEGTKVLKDNGVNWFRDMETDMGEFVNDSGIPSTPDHILFITRPSLHLMKRIAKHVTTSLKSGSRCQFHVLFVPQRTVACEQLLDELGVAQHLVMVEFGMGLVPLDSDLLSLEMNGVFKQCYVDGDTSSLNIVATALHRLQCVVGLIPVVRSKGAASRKVVQKLLRLRKEDANSKFPRTYPSLSNIDTMVILDREVDLVSPLVTPLTYEGVVDELVGIETGKIKVDHAILGEEEALKMPQLPGQPDAPAPSPAPVTRQPGEKVSLVLRNADSIYSEIKDMSIEKLGSYLQEKAIAIRSTYNSFREKKDASITEIHSFVKRMPILAKEYKALNQHINIAQYIKQTTDSRDFRELWQMERGILEGELLLDNIEDMVATDIHGERRYRALRLLCLQSVTSGGIRSNRFDQVRRLFSQVYGFDMIFSLFNLERAGLFRRRDLVLVDTQQAVWQTIRKQLKLINERVNMLQPDDIAYVSAGWTVNVELMRQLPGPQIEITQLRDDTGVGSLGGDELNEAVARAVADAAAAMSTSTLPYVNDMDIYDGNPSNKKLMLVFLVGGLSFLEVAAFRFLSKDPKYPYRIVLATTKLINGTSFLKTIEQKLGVF